MLIKSLKTLVCAALVSLTMQPAFAADLPGKGVTVRPIEGALLEEKFQFVILYKALEELGYTIGTPEEATYQTIHLALGTGDADFTAVHWDPLHVAFFAESGGEGTMTKVGDYIPGAVQGYLVDKASYDAGVNSIEALKDPAIAKRFESDNNGTADLTGCPPGWGCERVIEHHLDAYGLRDSVNHNQGQYNAIIGDTIARFKSGKSVIYYTWTPYWVSGELVPGKDVEWISVPYTSLPDGRDGNTDFDGKNLGFEVNSQRVVANNKFLDANPAARKLFEVAQISGNDVSAQNLKMRGGEDSVEDIFRHADEWIAANKATFDGWVAAARAAAE